MADTQYTGYKEICLTDDQFNQLYSQGVIDGYEFLENEYLIAKDEAGRIVDKLVCHDGKLTEVRFQTFKNTYTGTLKPRNEHQEIAFDMLKDGVITVKLITGTWGTGKTLALVVAALDAVQKGYSVSSSSEKAGISQLVAVVDTVRISLASQVFSLKPFCLM